MWENSCGSIQLSVGSTHTFKNTPSVPATSDRKESNYLHESKLVSIPSRIPMSTNPLSPLSNKMSPHWNILPSCTSASSGHPYIMQLDIFLSLKQYRNSMEAASLLLGILRDLNPIIHSNYGVENSLIPNILTTCSTYIHQQFLQQPYIIKNYCYISYC